MPSALSPTPIAVIIGASSGIGAALARKLAHEGYALALLARRVEALNELAEQINRQHGAGRARVYAHDVTHYAEAPTLFQTILRELGRIDAVIYNSGAQAKVALNEYDFDKDQQMVAVNVLGAIAWLNQAAVLFERQGSGHIIGISSIAGERGRVGAPGYGLTKAALTTFLESLRNRLTRKGVQVLTVKPGFVDTEMLKNAPRTMWVISPDQAATDIYQAMRARRQTLFTPARWGWVALILRHIPSFIFRRLSF